MANRISNFFRSILNIGEKRSSPNWTYRQPSPWLLGSSGSGVSVGESNTISISSVFQGLRFISSAIAAMPKTIIEEDDDGNIKYLKNHPLQPLFSIEAHPTCTPYDFIFGLVWQYKLRGNGVAVIERDLQTGRPRALRLIEWKDVTNIEEDKDTGVINYSILGYDQLIQHYDVIHIKNATSDGVVGIDTLLTHLENFGTDLAARKVSSSLYKNGSVLPGFLSTPHKIGPDARRSMEDSWNDRYSGPENAGKTPFFEGDVKYHKIALSPEESGLNAARQYNVYEVARILGVSPHVLYALDRANFSNIETLHLEIGKYTFAPIVESIEQELARKLPRNDEKGRVKVLFDMDTFTRGDTESRSKYIREMVQNGVFSINEARRMEGKNSVPFGDAFIIPKNMTLIDRDGNIVVAPEEGTSQNEDIAPLTNESQDIAQ